MQTTQRFSPMGGISQLAQNFVLALATAREELSFMNCSLDDEALPQPLLRYPQPSHVYDLQGFLQWRRTIDWPLLYEVDELQASGVENAVDRLEQCIIHSLSDQTARSQALHRITYLTRSGQWPRDHEL